ncbi:MAG: hypothetical protein J6336_08590, partial [Kiritimatiellae bacterium]|nr:hypothetical protein [Kiritimatiellia bacterium]
MRDDSSNGFLDTSLTLNVAVAIAIICHIPHILFAQPPDSDGDGIPDAAETSPIPVLWDAANPHGVLRPDLAGAAEVTATETLRAVRTESGTVALFDLDGSLLLTTNANATAVVASESRVCAITGDGHTVAWWPTAFGIASATLSLDADAVSGGKGHFLFRLRNGRAACVKYTGTNAFTRSTTTFTNCMAAAVSAGSAYDVILLANGTFRIGNAINAGGTALSPSASWGLGEICDIAVASNGYYAVLGSSGKAAGFYTSAKRSVTEEGFDITSIFASGARRMGALATDGTLFMTPDPPQSSVPWRDSGIVLEPGPCSAWWTDPCKAVVTASGKLTLIEGGVPLESGLSLTACAFTRGRVNAGIAITVLGTDPFNPDTDGDGLVDGEEVALGTDPFLADTDDDGLLDGEEVSIGSDPLLIDSDGDGLTDGEEVILASDPLKVDSDGDGLSDWEETVLGTDPREADSDHDGISDGTEAGLGTPLFWGSAGPNLVPGFPAAHAVRCAPGIASALLTDGRVLISRDGGIPADEWFDTPPAELTASLSGSIVARFPSGMLRVWRSDGASRTLDDIDVSELSGGWLHYLAITRTGGLLCLEESGDNLILTQRASAFTTLKAGTNVLAVSAGRGIDLAYLSNKTLRRGNALGNDSAYVSMTAFSDFTAGSNRVAAVLLDSYRATGYRRSSDTTTSYSSISGTLTASKGVEYLYLAGQGCPSVAAVKSDGTVVEILATNTLKWAATFTDVRLTDALDVSWTPGAVVLIDASGHPAAVRGEVMFPTVVPSLMWRRIALDPSDADRGVALVTTGTDPFNPDSDGDGYPDGWELSHGFDPLDYVSALTDSDGDGMPNEWAMYHGLSQASADADGDGLSNVEEFQKGTDPNNPDSDGDGMPDGWEVRQGLNPLNGDGSETEADLDGDGLSNLREFMFGSNPRKPDTDNDGLADGCEVDLYGTSPILADTDGDGMADGYEVSTAHTVYARTVEGLRMATSHTDPVSADSDGDGIGDRVELAMTHGGDGFASSTDPATADSDGDGLTDGEELSGWHKLASFVWPNADDAAWVCPDKLVYASLSVNLPFPVTFGGVAYTRAVVSSDGIVWFPPAGDTSTSIPFVTRYLHWCSNTGEIVEKANYSESGSRYVATIRRHTLSSGVAICAFDASLSKSAFDLFAVGTPGHRLIVFRWRDAEYTFATQTVAKKTFALIVSEGENSGVMLSYDNGFPSRTCSIGTTAGIHPDDFISVTADDFAHGVSKTYRIGTDGTIANGDSLFCGFGCGTNPVHWDTDGDGLSDGWEKANGLNPLNAVDASQDMDRDGLSNLQECLSGTDIRVADTDGDGLPDGWEVARGFNPLGPDDAVSDPDGDGLNTVTEYGLGTDPFRADTDGDGLSDRGEVQWGTNPLKRDTDGDGLSDGEEWDLGTSPLHADTDGDGLADKRELELGTDPINPDSDGDTLSDYDEIHIYGSDPLNADTDGDGISDAVAVFYGLDPTGQDAEKDTDGDGMTDREEILNGSDLSNPDTDGDGIPDGWEYHHGLSPVEASDAVLDLDGDGIINIREFRMGLDPEAGDTDNDGVSDGEEVAWGTDPLKTDSDGDGLPDGDERLLDTDPNDPDTDNDGLIDGVEAFNLDWGISPISQDADRDGVSDYDCWKYRGQLDNTDADGMIYRDKLVQGLPIGIDTKRDSDNDGWPDYLEKMAGDETDAYNRNKIPVGSDGILDVMEVTVSIWDKLADPVLLQIGDVRVILYEAGTYTVQIPAGVCHPVRLTGRQNMPVQLQLSITDNGCFVLDDPSGIFTAYGVQPPSELVTRHTVREGTLYRPRIKINLDGGSCFHGNRQVLTLAGRILPEECGGTVHWTFVESENEPVFRPVVNVRREDAGHTARFTWVGSGIGYRYYDVPITQCTRHDLTQNGPLWCDWHDCEHALCACDGYQPDPDTWCFFHGCPVRDCPADDEDIVAETLVWQGPSGEPGMENPDDSQGADPDPPKDGRPRFKGHAAESLAVNNDDDNGNGIEDRHDNDIMQEDDLKRFIPLAEPICCPCLGHPKPGWATLEMTSGVKLFPSPVKETAEGLPSVYYPTEPVYMEGLTPSKTPGDQSVIFDWKGTGCNPYATTNLFTVYSVRLIPDLDGNGNVDSADRALVRQMPEQLGWSMAVEQGKRRPVRFQCDVSMQGTISLRLKEGKGIFKLYDSPDPDANAIEGFDSPATGSDKSRLFWIEATDVGEGLLTADYEGMGAAEGYACKAELKLTALDLRIAGDGGERDQVINFDDPDDTNIVFWVNNDYDVIHDKDEEEECHEDDRSDSCYHPNCDDDVIGEGDTFNSNRSRCVVGCKPPTGGDFEEESVPIYKEYTCYRDLEDFDRLHIR